MCDQPPQEQVVTAGRQQVSADGTGGREDPIAKHGMPSAAAIRAAGEVYGAILADPDEARRLRAARIAYAAGRGEVICTYCCRTLELGDGGTSADGSVRCTHPSGNHRPHHPVGVRGEP